MEVEGTDELRELAASFSETASDLRATSERLFSFTAFTIGAILAGVVVGFVTGFVFGKLF